MEFNPGEINDEFFEELEGDEVTGEATDENVETEEEQEMQPSGGETEEESDDDDNPQEDGGEEEDEQDDGEEYVEEDDFITKLLEDPKEAVKMAIKEDPTIIREVIAEEIKNAQRIVQEEQQKYQEYLRQKEELKQTYAPDFDEVMSEDVLKKIADNPEIAAEIYNSPNMAEKAYYYAKFGTTSPTLKQIESLIGGKGKRAPKPIGGGGKQEVPGGDFDYDPAGVDFDD